MWAPDFLAQQSRLLHIFTEKAPDFFRFSFLDPFFRTPIYGLTVGFARRCNPFGRRKGARTLTCIKIISAFSAEIEPKGVRVLPTSCGRRTAGHDACYFKKGAENTAFFTCENVLQMFCCKQLFISLKYRQNGSNFAFMWLVVYFPDIWIYLAETAVIFVVSNR
ncbi:MAG: hypothetical protein ACI4KR_09895 [Ruminiclostridium sp.]